MNTNGEPRTEKREHGFSFSFGGPVLITGATGFAGGHLVELLAGTADLVGWGRSQPASGVARLARWDSIDLLDRQRVLSAMAGLRPSAIFHLAGAPQVAQSWRDTARSLEQNVMATAHVLDAVRRAAIDCRMLVAGSAAVYAASEKPIRETDPLRPANPYALSKLAQEQLALRAHSEDGVQVIVVRPFNHTGPRQSQEFVAPSIAHQIALIEAGQCEPVIRVGNLDPYRDFTDVRDVVRAYASVMERGTPGAVYNVGSGVAHSIGSVLEAMLSIARAPVRVETDASRLRPSDTPMLVADIGRIRDEIGWRPAIAFETTLSDLLDYWRTQVHEARA